MRPARETAPPAQADQPPRSAPPVPAPPPPAARRRGSRRARAESTSAYAMITPFLVLVLLFQVYVLASGIRLSLTNAQGIYWGHLVGLRNYQDLLWADWFLAPEFRRAAAITGKFTLGCLVTQVPLAFLLAYGLNHIPFGRIRGLIRAAFLVPLLINTVTTAFLFGMCFQREGLINLVLGRLGLPNHVDWLMDSDLAMPIMIGVSLWRIVGFQTVIFLGQLQTIDPTLYEAARMDGASTATVLLRITLPLLRPAVVFCMVTTAIGALQMFDLAFMLFPAPYGPGGSARTLVAFIYDLGLSSRFMTGLASAAGWLTFLIVMGVSLLQLRLLGLGRQES